MGIGRYIRAFVAGFAVASLSATAGEPSSTSDGRDRPWWSLTPLKRPAVTSGARHPIDAFIRSKLQGRAFGPAGEADARTLLRRLSYDLTGLPPSPGEEEAFCTDRTAEAFGRAVDRFLASPRYGEHWARHWLDVANYADTHGNDHDYARPNAWPYRDYVIRAFNSDKPYGRFVREQIAGDVLYPGDPEATVALGFLAAGPWDHTLMVTVREDTVDHRMSQVLDRDGMVCAVIGAFDSLTIQCARCHNHKFDPISQREYYALQAVFAGVDRADRPFDDDPATHRIRAQLRSELLAAKNRSPGLLQRLGGSEGASRTAAYEAELKRREAQWTPLDVIGVVSTGGATLTRQADRSWLASGARPDRDSVIVTARLGPGGLAALRLETLPDASLPHGGPGRWDNGNFHLTEFRAYAATNAGGAGAIPIVFARATADFDEGPAVSAAQAIDGRDDTHWGIHPRYGEPHEAVFELKTPLSLPDGGTLTVILENQAGAPGHGIGRFRLSTSAAQPGAGSLRPAPTALRAILSTPPERRTEASKLEAAVAVVREQDEAALGALPAPRYVYAVSRDFPPDGDNFKPAAEPRPIRILTRGDLSKPGELVGPGALSCVPGMSPSLELGDPMDESARRAALAGWVADERNVLTWRSIVNRVWALHFGRGLCDTPNDFGRMGGEPSHPELLDWLAVWFRDEAHGSLKALHRLILTSETWRQSTVATAGAAEDPDNRLLWRQNRRRLSAEEVRDTALALAGALDATMGGPPAIQFIEHGDATFNPGGNPAFLDYEHFDQDAPAARRRSVYRFIFRTVPDPFMDALDCPDGGSTTPVRAESTTAVQALAMLNDPFLIRQSLRMAQRMGATARTPTEKADAVFRLILLRPPSAEEHTRIADYIARHGLADAAQMLLNSNEFLYLD
jgi:Protein of unknown function (DUF1553)/Protein of unknown function (DUF1549)